MDRIEVRLQPATADLKNRYPTMGGVLMLNAGTPLPSKGDVVNIHGAGHAAVVGDFFEVIGRCFTAGPKEQYWTLLIAPQERDNPGAPSSRSSLSP